MTMFEMSPEKYADQYLFGKKQRISRNMSYGSMFADSLESGEASGDPLLDFMASSVPKFERMDLPVESGQGTLVQNPRNREMYCVPVLPNKPEGIPLLALPDSAKEDYSAFIEYKTSVREWTQKMADDSGQITFYATAMWLVTGKIPKDIELVNVPVKYASDSSLTPQGTIVRLKTERTMVDIIKMVSRIKKCWSGIIALCESELL